MERRPCRRKTIPEAVADEREHHPLSRRHLRLLRLFDLLAGQVEVCLAVYALARVSESSLDSRLVSSLHSVFYCTLLKTASPTDSLTRPEIALFLLWEFFFKFKVPAFISFSKNLFLSCPSLSYACSLNFFIVSSTC